MTITVVENMNHKTDLLSKAEIKIAKYRDHRQKTGQNFNVFRLLDRHKNEVKGHSAFLVEFLNPHGAHGQGSIFLKSFFELLGISAHVAGCEKWKVHVEYDKNVDGRIDILLIGTHDSGQRVGIAIENKIYADDQELQLKRYYDHLKKHYRAMHNESSSVSWLLYYLTLPGDEPSSQSISGIPRELCDWLVTKGGSENTPVRLISYSKEIKSWMTLCHER